jgi:CBS domain-containing protein
MRIADLLRHKGSTVATVSGDATVSELVTALAEHNVGALVVTDGDAIAGIVSERDVVRRLNSLGSALLVVPVSDIMTASVVTCAPTDSVDSLAATMTERRIRHMPVVEDDRLVGIVSIGDVVKSRIEQLESDREQLQSYIAQG